MKSETGHNIAQMAKKKRQEQAQRLQHIREKYAHPIDRARALRDMGVKQFHHKTSEWRESLVSSIRELEVVRDPDIDEGDLLRAQSLGNEVLGRTDYTCMLRHGFRSCYPSALAKLHLAQIKLRYSDNDKSRFRPNQQEIGLVLAVAIGERCSPYSGRGLRALGRAALIAPFNETRFARHRTKDLTREERIEIWKRSLGHLAFATRLAFAPKSYADREYIRQKTADIMIGGLPSNKDDKANALV